MQLPILVSGIMLLLCCPWCSSYVTPASTDMVKVENPSGICRTRDKLLPPNLFALDTCAMCYNYMLSSVFASKARLVGGLPISEQADLSSVSHLQLNNITVLADANDPQSPLIDTFLDEVALNKWKACCCNAKECCKRMLADKTATENGWCPRTWDGWLCWDDAPPSTSQLASCPEYIASGSEPISCMSASKTCEDGGNWYRAGSKEEWTNYSTCSVLPNLQKRAYVSITAYGVTIVALIPALIILSIYRQLRVPRVTLHRQLFASLLFNAIAVITFKSAVLIPATLHTPLISQDSVACKLLLLMTKYLRLTNYMWMFCEGFYLHRLISAAFVEHTSLLLFYCIGWGLPLIPTSVYVLLRVFDTQDEHSHQCWAFPHGLSEWIFYVPCLLSLALNLVFLVDIIRILWLKLRARHEDEPSQYRKTVRATLVLVPLFGLHLTLTMYRPASGPCNGTFIQLYYMADYLLDGLQGFLVALSFCYCNGEVLSLLRRSYQRFMESHHPSLMLHSLISIPQVFQTTESEANPNRRARPISTPMEDKSEPDAEMHLEPGAKMLLEPGAEMHLEPGAEMHLEPDAEMHLEPGAVINLEPDAEMHLEPGAEMHLEPDAEMHLESGAVINLEPDAEMHLEPGAVINLEPDAEMHLEPGAVINLEPDAEMHLEPGAVINLEPDAEMHLEPGAAVINLEPDAEMHLEPGAVINLEPDAEMHLEPGAAVINLEPDAEMHLEPGAAVINLKPDAEMHLEPGAEIEMEIIKNYETDL